MKEALALMYQSKKIMSHIKLFLGITSKGRINKVFSSTSYFNLIFSICFSNSYSIKNVNN